MVIWKEVQKMKKLTKIKLVNWHLFSDETIIIKDNTLISGENGSGKTQLLNCLYTSITKSRLPSMMHNPMMHDPMIGKSGARCPLAPV